MMIDEDRIVGVSQVTLKQLAAELGVSLRTAKRGTKALIDRGYLVEIPGGFLATMPPEHKDNA
jgi:DeoR/GlpR family transcriptional regulator of sugar metabolism